MKEQTQNRRELWKTCAGTPSATCSSRRCRSLSGVTSTRPTWPHAVGAPRSTARSTAKPDAVPAERLLSERDVLRPLPAGRPPLRAGDSRTVDKRGSIRRIGALPGSPNTGGRVRGSGRHRRQGGHSDAGTEVIRHDPVGPGEVACGDLVDPHRRLARGIRPRTASEIAFVGLGPVAEVFLRNAAAAGTLRLEHELTAIVELTVVWSREVVIRALDRATRFRRFKASDVRAILEAGPGVPMPVRAGQQLALELPEVPVLSEYAVRAVSA